MAKLACAYVEMQNNVVNLVVAKTSREKKCGLCLTSMTLVFSCAIATRRCSLFPSSSAIPSLDFCNSFNMTRVSVIAILTQKAWLHRGVLNLSPSAKHKAGVCV
jgi:hypothetical protein